MVETFTSGGVEKKKLEALVLMVDACTSSDVVEEKSKDLVRMVDTCTSGDVEEKEFKVKDLVRMVGIYTPRLCCRQNFLKLRVVICLLFC
jgi:hypothetical protein